MKKVLYVSFCVLLFGCSLSEDCFKNSGATTTKIIALPSESHFDKIYVFPHIKLVLAQGDENAITVKAGSNIIDDISVRIVNDSLLLQDNSGCNLNRQYGNKTVFVTAKDVPVMTIYSNTEQQIVSDGVLTFPVLNLYAMDYFGGVGTGDFNLDVNNIQTVIETNNVATFKMRGHTNVLWLNFYDGLGRFEGAEMPATTIRFFQRSANDFIIRPTDSLIGNLHGTGNVRCLTQPYEVQVQRHYSGRLIFE